VLASSASSKVRTSVAQVVAKCFESAEVPMTKSGFERELLYAALEEVGESW
jgi:hypothetical protein